MPNTSNGETKSTASQQFKSGLITLVGRSNVGKSTLLNALVGTKIAAVTDKPQTTRAIIHGVLNHPEGQAVFVDTPGVFKEHRGHLSGPLLERVHEALQDIDMVLYVVDPGKPLGAEERYTLSLLRNLTQPKILVINKTDVPEAERAYLDEYRALNDDFIATFEISALRRRHLQPLIEKVFALLPAGEALYPPDQLTNIDKNFWIAELIREKIFLALRKEVPYTTHVEVTNVENRPDLTLINATIFTFDRRYKQMIIGKGGRAIKEIGIAARKELEQATNQKVFLELEVETDKHWMERV